MSKSEKLIEDYLKEQGMQVNSDDELVKRLLKMAKELNYVKKNRKDNKKHSH